MGPHQRSPKSTAAITGVVPLAAVILTGTSWRDRVRGVTIVCLIPAVIAGWFYVRSLVMWGNLFASDDFGVVLHPHGLTDPLYRTVFFDTLFNSYWFTGGWANIHFLPLTYRLLAIFPALAAGGVIVGLRRSPLDRVQRFGLCAFVVLLVIAILGVIEYSVVQDYGPQGRYLFGVQRDRYLAHVRNRNRFLKRRRNGSSGDAHIARRPARDERLGVPRKTACRVWLTRYRQTARSGQH